MEIIASIVFVIAGLFAFVVIFGAPYVPTLRRDINDVLDGLDLHAGQLLIDVGSGDGRVLVAAAERGWRAVGYELNPILVLWTKWRIRKYNQNVQVIWGNALTRQWPSADAIYIFGVARIMPKLHTKIIQSIDKPVRVASFGFEISGAKKIAQKRAVHIYEYRPKA